MGIFSSKTKVKYDPKVMEAGYDNLDRATGLYDSFKPYEGELNAPANQNLQNYWGGLANLAGSDVGAGSLNAARDGLMGLMDYSPQQVQAPQMQAAQMGPVERASATGAAMIAPGSMAQAGYINPAQMAQAGMADRSQIRNIGLQGFSRDALEPFLNPATEALVTARLNDNERGRTIQRNADSGEAARMGGWGGSRHGVADARTNEAFQRTGDMASADARGRAWDSAVSAFFTGRGQDLSAEQSNQNADMFVVGQNAETGRFNAGQQNTGLLSNAETSRFNAGQTNAAILDNANTGRFNANLLANVDMFNAGEANDASATSAGFLQDAAGRNQNATLEALLANQDADIAGAGLRLNGALGLMDLSGQELGQAATRMGFLGLAGEGQQNFDQAALDRDYGAWLQDWETRMGLQGLATGAFGALPKPSTQSQTPGLFDWAKLALAGASMFGGGGKG